MGNAANIEGRVKKLENLLKEETGVGTGTTGSETVIRYPVRQLTLKEEVSHDDAGVPTSTVAVSWKSPAGSMIPDKIKLVIGAETVELDGQTTTYRKGGYAAGDVVKVIAVAVYSTGNSSAVVAQLTLTGNGEAPETPEGFTAQGGFGTITLTWAIPDNPNHSHMEVWESVIYDNLESAERIAQAYGSEFVRSNVGVLETRWYWIRAVDTGGNKGEFVGPRSATTTAIQPEAIPDGTIEESKLVGALSQKINDSSAAIAVIEDVRSGDIKAYHQPTAPTSGMQAGDIWIDNNEAVWRYIGGEWQKQENTTEYDLLKAAIVQYTVKTQVAVDGKLKVAGFGLFNDSSAGSEFAILADRFYIYGQKSDGTYSNVKVFSVDTTQSPPVVGINGNLIVDGTLNGSKLFAGSTIQLGTIVNGVLTSGKLIIGEGGVIQIGDNIIIDGGSGTFFLRASDNENNHVYIGGGVVRISRDFGDVQPYVYLLSRLGTASGLTNNESKALSGVWSQEPVVAIGLSDIVTYDPSYGASLFISSNVAGVTYVGGGVYSIKAMAETTVSGGQYVWGVTQTIPASGAYTWSVTGSGSPTQEYVFDWHGAVKDIQSISFIVDISTVRSAGNYRGCNSIANIYIDYIEQSTGNIITQGVYTVVIESYPYMIGGDGLYTYHSGIIELGNLASDVRIRVVMSNDGSSYIVKTWWGECRERVSFRGLMLYKATDVGESVIYNGSVFALAIGR